MIITLGILYIFFKKLNIYIYIKSISDSLVKPLIHLHWPSVSIILDHMNDRISFHSTTLSNDSYIVVEKLFFFFFFVYNRTTLQSHQITDCCIHNQTTLQSHPCSATQITESLLPFVQTISTEITSNMHHIHKHRQALI